MNKKVAILDLGTNTFHLLIADLNAEGTFNVIYKAEEFVKLGEDGLDRIGENPFRRGLEQIRKYAEIIRHYEVTDVIGFGTAAIRRASNGDEFTREIKKICPMEVKKISGDEEAELIYLGVRQAVTLNEQPVLIMDIGGGSTEFIIANNSKIHWKESFPVGASVLKQKFHHQEPISEAEISDLENYLKEVLRPLFDQRNLFPLHRLVGASGSFDTFAKMLIDRFHLQEASDEKKSLEISPEHFYVINNELIKSNLEERLQLNGMIWFRAEMITVASILTAFVLKHFNIQQITQSVYALKEGVLWKLVQKEKL